MEDITTRLRVMVQQDQLRELKQNIVGARDEITRTAKEFTSLDDAMMSPALQQATRELREMEIEADRLEKAIRNVTLAQERMGESTQAIRIASGSAAGDGGMFGGRTAMGINQLVQGFEDLQYSVGGAMNNIGSAVMMFGGPAGLIALATAAGIAINQLAKHWDQVKEAFASFTTDSVVAELNKVITAADKARETAVKVTEEGGLKAAVGARGAEDTAAGKMFGEALKSTLRPGQIGADVIREFSNLIGGGTPAGMQAVQERFGRAMAGSREEMRFFADVGREAAPGTLARGLAEEIGRVQRDDAEKARQKGLSPAEKKIEDLVDRLQLAMNTGAEAFTDAAKEFARMPPSQRQAVIEESRRAPLLTGRLEQEEQRIADAAHAKEQEHFAKLIEEGMTEGKHEAEELRRQQKHVDDQVEQLRQRQGREGIQGAERVGREDEHTAREILRDPRMKLALESQFAGGRKSEDIAPDLKEFLVGQGLAPDDRAAGIAGAMTKDTRDEMNRRLAGYTARGLTQTEAFAAIQEEVLMQMQQIDMKLNNMEQSLMRQQGVMQGFKQTRLNRGDMP